MKKNNNQKLMEEFAAAVVLSNIDSRLIELAKTVLEGIQLDEVEEDDPEWPSAELKKAANPMSFKLLKSIIAKLGLKDQNLGLYNIYSSKRNKCVMRGYEDDAFFGSRMALSIQVGPIKGVYVFRLISGGFSVSGGPAKDMTKDKWNDLKIDFKNIAKNPEKAMKSMRPKEPTEYGAIVLGHNTDLMEAIDDNAKGLCD